MFIGLGTAARLQENNIEMTVKPAREAKLRQ